MSSIEILRMPYFVKRVATSFSIFSFVSLSSIWGTKLWKLLTLQKFPRFPSTRFLSLGFIFLRNFQLIFTEPPTQTVEVSESAFEVRAGPHHLSFIFCLNLSRSSALIRFHFSF